MLREFDHKKRESLRITHLLYKDQHVAIKCCKSFYIKYLYSMPPFLLVFWHEVLQMFTLILVLFLLELQTHILSTCLLY